LTRLTTSVLLDLYLPMHRSFVAGLAAIALSLAGCSDENDGADRGASGGASGGEAGRVPVSGAGGTAGEIGAAGLGGAAGSMAGGAGVAAAGTAALAGAGGGAGEAARGGTGGAAMGGAGAGSANAGGSGASAGAGGANAGGSGASAGAGGASAGGSGGPPGDPGACPSPFTTVDLSNLDAEEILEPYAVTGSTANEIRQSINQNRGRDYDAYTDWFISWQYTTSLCDGSGLRVTVDVTYSVPEWNPPVGADPALVESWESYIDALFCHEFGHALHGLEAANDVYDELSSIDTGGDCAAQQELADAAFQSIIDEYAALEVAYDDETNHGATMGAVFPPP